MVPHRQLQDHSSGDLVNSFLFACPQLLIMLPNVCLKKRQEGLSPTLPFWEMAAFHLVCSYASKYCTAHCLSLLSWLRDSVNTMYCLLLLVYLLLNHTDVFFSNKSGHSGALSPPPKPQLLTRWNSKTITSWLSSKISSLNIHVCILSQPDTLTKEKELLS